MGSLSRGTKADQFTYVPAGTVLPFAGATAPAGWAICNGDPVSRTDYAELFTAIGELWGVGDGSTTFNLPDMRGQFLRGKDYGRNAIDGKGNPDGDLDVGVYTEDAMQRITGQTYPEATIPYSIGSGGIFQGVFNQGGTVGNRVSTQAGTGGRTLLFDSASSTSPNPAKTNDNETRPKNVTVNYIIKL